MTVFTTPVIFPQKQPHIEVLSVLCIALLIVIHLRGEKRLDSKVKECTSAVLLGMELGKGGDVLGREVVSWEVLQSLSEYPGHQKLS